MTTAVSKLAAAMTDANREIAGFDPLIRNEGARVVYDFTNPTCNGNADGAIANGATFTNLVIGGPANTATVVGSGFSNATGLAGLIATGGGAYIDCGATELYSRQHAFLAIGWHKLPTSGFATTYPELWRQYGGTGNANSAITYVGFNSGGNQPQAVIGTGSGQSGISVNPGTGLGTVQQIAQLWRPDGYHEMFINGVSVGSDAAATQALVAPTQNLRLGGAYIGRIYFFALFDLMQPRRSAATILANDYAYRFGKFT